MSKAENILKAVERNDGYCPCGNNPHTEDYKCPCKEFRENKKCKCGLYNEDGTYQE